MLYQETQCGQDHHEHSVVASPIILSCSNRRTHLSKYLTTLEDRSISVVLKAKEEDKKLNSNQAKEEDH